MNKLLASRGRRASIVLALVMLLGFVELIHIAWIGDDAAITLRTVLNLSYGYGPVFNISERVQAYSHPLWFVLIALLHLIVPNVLLVCFALSIFVALLTLWLVIKRVSPNLLCACVAAGLLLVSKAYVDFSASGLENPLSHLILVGIFIAAERTVSQRSQRWYRALLLIGSLSYLTRPDLVLFYIPVLVYVTCVYRPRLSDFITWSFIAALPCVVWTLFTLFYYGLPVPNTALAKLSGGLSSSARMAQGMKYFKESLLTDPVTLVTIAAALGVGFVRSWFDRAFALGIALYLLYVLRIGGDFMSGRFFTSAFLVATLIITRKDGLVPRLGCLLVALGAAYLYPNVIKLGAVGMWDHSTGVVDERRFYYPRKTLLYSREGPLSYEKTWREFNQDDTPPRVVTECGGIGYTGLRGGPGLHVIDRCALADPLLVALSYFTGQRVGHWQRDIPTNYELSVLEDKNFLTNEELKTFYDDVREVTRGELFSFSRIKIIVNWLTGGRSVFPPLWKVSPPRFTPDATQKISAKLLGRKIKDGGTVDDADNLLLLGIPLEVSFDRPVKLGVVDISLDADDVYLIEYFDGTEFKPLFELGSQQNPEMTPYIVRKVQQGSVRYRREVLGDKPSTDRLRITAIKPDRGTAVGHLRVFDDISASLEAERGAK